MSRALEIRDLYDNHNESKHKKWETSDYVTGFVGDVGDLAKLSMAEQNLRSVGGEGDVNDKLAHELADCLWSILVISKGYNIDLSSAFAKTMDELEERLS